MTQTPQSEQKEFQAEVKKLLDIVIHSLYTEKEIFVRELVSNAADALEKFRHQSLLEKDVFDSHLPLEITIDPDDKKHLLTILDTGIGMTREELEKNLGTIAHSGSKTFLTQLEKHPGDLNLIGQFGVGFYSVFMAAKNVRVQTRSYHTEDEGWEWSSDGAGSYTITPCPGIRRGTKIIIELRDDAHEYSDKRNIERIVKQYSAFVPFPIKVKGETVNTVQALWAKSKDAIVDKEYEEFYKYIANAMDEPLSRLHFTTDAPLAIKALLFVPKENVENMGFGRMDPGINLYCQKVLIEQHSHAILPEWLRFLKGVVDSDDLPLNISRQALQDNALVARIKTILTRRFLKFLAEQAKNSPEVYEKFWDTFGIFLKEGVTTDFAFQEELGKLLRFESSATEAGKTTSLTEYVERMAEGQDEIYYINGPNRVSIQSGPYVETFTKKNIEIIYTLEPIDDFVLSHLREFDGKKLVSADRSDLKLPDVAEQKKDDAVKEEETPAAEPLAQPVLDSLLKWTKEVLGDRVKDVRASNRLVASPAMIVNPDGFMTSTMERVLRTSGQAEGMPAFGAKDLEINPGHPLVKKLADLRTSDEAFAKEVVRQLLDNTMLQAGLPVEPREFVQRSNRILERIAG